MIAGNDSNIIKPVEGSQNISGLTPTKRQEQRKRRQNLHKQNEEEPEKQLNESLDEQNLSDKSAENEADRNIPFCDESQNGNPENTIDYRA